MPVNPRPKPPLAGGEYTFMTDTGRQAVPPGTPVVNLIPVGDGGPGSLLPRSRKRKPALPSAAAVAALPAGARYALAARCALRVAPLIRFAGDGNEVAATLVAAVAILRAASDPREVRVIRRDFERVRRLAKANGWTDDTPVPQEVFGPMWPEGRVPEWAQETSGPRS